MKTAEEWASEIPKIPLFSTTEIATNSCIALVKQIQLDAWKQGMSDALDELYLVSRISNCPLSDAEAFIKNAIRLKLSI